MHDLYLMLDSEGSDPQQILTAITLLEQQQMLHWPAALGRGLRQLRFMAAVPGLALTGDLVPTPERVEQFVAATEEQGFVLAFRCRVPGDAKLGVFWHGEDPVPLSAEKWWPKLDEQGRDTPLASLYLLYSGVAFTPQEMVQSPLGQALLARWPALRVGIRRAVD